MNAIKTSTNSQRLSAWVLAYLALLALELLVVLYRSLDEPSALSALIRAFVLIAGLLGVYGWNARRWISSRAIWRLVFALVCLWFIAYFPLVAFHNRELFKEIALEMGMEALVFGYALYYVLHGPMLVYLYFCAFRDLPNPDPQAS